MLNRIHLKTNDKRWAGILADFGANVSERGIEFPQPLGKISADELSAHIERLKSQRLRALGAVGKLSDAEERLLMMLPMSPNELKKEMGYADASTTHTIETLVYNIRKKMGAGFIKLEDGEYKL